MFDRLDITGALLEGIRAQSWNMLARYTSIGETEVLRGNFHFWKASPLYSGAVMQSLVECQSCIGRLADKLQEHY